MPPHSFKGGALALSSHLTAKEYNCLNPKSRDVGLLGDLPSLLLCIMTLCPFTGQTFQGVMKPHGHNAFSALQGEPSLCLRRKCYSGGRHLKKDGGHISSGTYLSPNLVT